MTCRHMFVRALGCALSCALFVGCSTQEASRFSLSSDRSLSSLTDAEVATLCRENVARQLSVPTLLDAAARAACVVSAHGRMLDPAACSASLEMCIMDTGAEVSDAFCDDAVAVPSCDPSITVADYEACLVHAESTLLAGPYACDDLVDEASWRAASDAYQGAAVAPGCEFLRSAECFFFTASGAERP